MKTIAIDIPEELLFDLKIPKERRDTELRKELALQLIVKNSCPLGMLDD